MKPSDPVSPSLPVPGGTCPLPLRDHREITMAHGSGGKLTRELIETLILPAFRNPLLEPLHDGAVFDIGGVRLAFSTDSHVIHPIFFPGGDIGSLAVHGTVNDLAMCGAEPCYLSVGFIIEEGLPMADLDRIVRSMRTAADEAGVLLVTGDTKVVERGKADRLFINTAGIGRIPSGVNLGPAKVQPGDRILVSGPIAVHGIAILSVREHLAFETELQSDTASLNGLVSEMFRADMAGIHCLRDPTRGGVSAALSEIAGAAGCGMILQETAIPMDEQVRGACEILGLDPLHVANEGKLLAVVAEDAVDRVLKALRAHPLGRDAVEIGRIVPEHPGMVILNTRVGGTRVVEPPSGEQLPRIC
jgi:hydrogenase expression/formation protein HypE